MSWERSVMLRLVAPGDDARAGVETGAAEGELEEPPQDGSRAAVRSRAKRRLSMTIDIRDSNRSPGKAGGFMK